MIEVRIGEAEIMEHKNALFAPFLVAKLREAGIPAKGCFSFQGVRFGKLEWFQDYWSTDMIFRWEV